MALTFCSLYHIFIAKGVKISENIRRNGKVNRVNEKKEFFHNNKHQTSDGIFFFIIMIRGEFNEKKCRTRLRMKAKAKEKKKSNSSGGKL